eukprot:878452-Rhodomonas_salina.5
MTDRRVALPAIVLRVCPTMSGTDLGATASSRRSNVRWTRSSALSAPRRTTRRFWRSSEKSA